MSGFVQKTVVVQPKRYTVTGQGPSDRVSFEVEAYDRYDAIAVAKKKCILNGMKATTKEGR